MNGLKNYWFLFHIDKQVCFLRFKIINLKTYFFFTYSRFWNEVLNTDPEET